uniref:Uncharacterized protein n=1 Tax=Biomphalaria glabrata TaxID=6526 RepID=A0A2C9KMP3_BIOGL
MPWNFEMFLCISTLQTDVLDLKEENKTLENQVSMLNEEIKNLKKQPQALKDDFREEEPNNVIANRLIGELKKEEDSTNYVGQEESKSHY